MSESNEDWFPVKKNLIQMIKERPIIYVTVQDMSVKQQQRLRTQAWDEIGKGSVSYAYKPLWKKIRLRYAKLQILIKTGKISIQTVKSNPKTSRYLDGTLSFLDPHLKERTDRDIPFQVHKYINDIFGIETSHDYSTNTNRVTHAQIRFLLKKRDEEGIDTESMNMQYLLVEEVIKRKLNELLPKKLDPNKNTFDRNDLGLESELMLAAHIFKTDEDNATEDNFTIESNINDIFVNNNAIDIEHSSPNSQINMTLVDDNSLDNTENVSTMTESEINNKLIGVSDNNLRKFFNELGEIMSMELSMEKQQILKLRINSLVKNIWEDV